MYRVCVLMSTYNGEKYIKRQLETLLKQKEVDIHILIRDDGSKDNTVEIVKNLKSSRIDLFEGTNLGYAQSFWSLLKIDNDFDYYAFCDQDDIWFEDKIISAINLLKCIEGPTLYTSDVITVDVNENIIKKNSFGVIKTLNYAESLIKSVLPGCTFVFNKQLKEKMSIYDGFIISHDWTAYIVANALGQVVFDYNPHIYYRIHENNTIGVNNPLLDTKKKFIRLFNPKQTNTRSKVAKNIYQYYSGFMSAENKELTKAFSEYPSSIRAIKRLLSIKEYQRADFILMLVLRRV